MIYKKLKEAKEARGVSAYKIATDTGLDRSQVSKYFRTGKNLSVGKIEVLLEYFGLHLCEPSETF